MALLRDGRKIRVKERAKIEVKTKRKVWGEFRKFRKKDRLGISQLF